MTLLLRFINVLNAVKEATPAWPELDAVEDRVFIQLTAVWHAGQDITVLEAANMLPELSESTAHKKLKSLRHKGVIEFTQSVTDGRSKLIKPTRLTNEYFSRIEILLK